MEVLKDDGRIVRYAEVHQTIGNIVLGQTRVTQGQPIAVMAHVNNTQNLFMLHLEYFMGTASVDTETNRLSQTGNMTYDYVPSGNFHRRRDLLDPIHFTTLPMW